jgi:peptidoglycan/xylan/chitin deacetylase (PgdA/CDA1 family)
MSTGGTLVLLYHRVAELARDPHGLAVHPDRFAQHCEVLRRRCEVVPLRDATRSRRQVAITFDDGYADNAAEARRILAAAGLPATFFVTAGRLGERTEVWWDRLAQIVLECPTTARALDVEIDGRRLWIDIRSATARERAHKALFYRLRPLRSETIAAIVSDLEVRLDVRSVDREKYRWMTVEELRALASSHGVDIGAHTLAHPFLVTLDAEEQWREIDGSRRSLEALLGTPVDLFSYPYGGPDALNAVTVAQVRKAGYTMACVAAPGVARADCDTLRIPRNVVGDWDADRFDRWLNQWLTTP